MPGSIQESRFGSNWGGLTRVEHASHAIGHRAFVVVRKPFVDLPFGSWCGTVEVVEHQLRKVGVGGGRTPSRDGRKPGKSTVLLKGVALAR